MYTPEPVNVVIASCFIHIAEGYVLKLSRKALKVHYGFQMCGSVGDAPSSFLCLDISWR